MGIIEKIEAYQKEHINCLTLKSDEKRMSQQLFSWPKTSRQKAVVLTLEYYQLPPVCSGNTLKSTPEKTCIP